MPKKPMPSEPGEESFSTEPKALPAPQDSFEDLEFVIEDDEELVSNPDAAAPESLAWLSGTGGIASEGDTVVTSTADEMLEMQRSEVTPSDENNRIIGAGDLMTQLESLESQEIGAVAPADEEFSDSSQHDVEVFGNDIASGPDDLGPDLVVEPEPAGAGSDPDFDSQPSRSWVHRYFWPMMAASLFLTCAGLYLAISPGKRAVDVEGIPVAEVSPTTPIAPVAAVEEEPATEEPVEFFADADSIDAADPVEPSAEETTDLAEAVVEPDPEPVPGLETVETHPAAKPTPFSERSPIRSMRSPRFGQRLISSITHPPVDPALAKEIQTLEEAPLADNEIIVALTNGNTFQGALKRITPTELVLRFGNGEITFPRESLEGILPQDSAEYQPVGSFPTGYVEFTHGDKIYGRILHMTDRRVIMDFAGARLVFPKNAVQVDLRSPVLVRSDLQ